MNKVQKIRIKGEEFYLLSERDIKALANQALGVSSKMNELLAVLDEKPLEEGSLQLGFYRIQSSGAVHMGDNPDIMLCGTASKHGFLYLGRDFKWNNDGWYRPRQDSPRLCSNCRDINDERFDVDIITRKAKVRL